MDKKGGVLDRIPSIKKKRVQLVLIPILLGLFAIWFQADRQIQASESILQEKFIDKRFDIDIICDQTDAFIRIDADWGEYDYQTILTHSIKLIDEQPYTYAGIFDSDLTDISIRHPSYSTSFEPLLDPGFLDATKSNQSGDYVMSFTPEGEPPRDMYLYYRWVPTDTSLDGRFLLVIAISSFSVANKLTSWIPWGTLPISLFLIVGGIWVAIRQIRLGEIWKQRPEEGEGKWRGTA